MNTKLQIISGKYRGRKLKIPENARPTQQRARGAVFNMLAEIIGPGHLGAVWDAFAGSGAMGIEFISRFGAAHAVFTDIGNGAIACISENTKNITDCEIIVKKHPAANEFGNLFSFASSGGNLTAFIDPPYSNPFPGDRAVCELAEHAPTGTIIVWEIESNRQPNIPKRVEILKDKTYGRARFLILRKPMDQDN